MICEIEFGVVSKLARRKKTISPKESVIKTKESASKPLDSRETFKRNKVLACDHK